MLVTVPVTFVQLPELADATIVVPLRACATLPAARAFAMDRVVKPAGMVCVAHVPQESLVPPREALLYAQIDPVAQLPTERARGFGTVMDMSKLGQYAS